MLKPIKNYILFQFINELSGAKRKHTDKTFSGIFIPVLDSRQNIPRWGKVIAKGPDAGVEVDEYILIEPLQWSFSIKVDEVELWKTDDEKVLFTVSEAEDMDVVGF